VDGLPAHDRRGPPVGYAKPLAQVVEERLAPLEERADGRQRQVDRLVVRQRPGDVIQVAGD